MADLDSADCGGAPCSLAFVVVLFAKERVHFKESMARDIDRITAYLRGAITFLGELLVEWKGGARHRDNTMKWDERLYNVGSAPLLDAEHREVGRLMVLSDVTASIHETGKELLWIIAYASLGGAALSIFLYYHLKAAENELEHAHAQIVAAAKAREADQRRHIEELTGRINDLEHFERLTIGRELRIQALKTENRQLRASVDAESNPRTPTGVGVEYTTDFEEKHDDRE